MKLKLFAIMALGAVLALPSCAPEEESTKDEKSFRPNVQVENAVSADSFSHWITLQASVEARKNVVLNAEMGGIIRSINVDKGQYVTRGKVLAVIDSDIMSQNISELQSGIELAEYNRDKQRKLFAQNIGTEFDLKQAESQVEQLYRKLATLRTQAGKSVIVAPFDGYVEDIGSYVGELAAPQIPLIRFKIKMESHSLGKYQGERSSQGKELQL
jgi:multidrug resistance efflux pump